MNQKGLKEECSIYGTIDRFESAFAVIITEDKQKLLWPIKKLPDSYRAGKVIKIKLETNEDKQKEREQLAKTILNQILKKHENNGE